MPKKPISDKHRAQLERNKRPGHGPARGAGYGGPAKGAGVAPGSPPVGSHNAQTIKDKQARAELIEDFWFDVAMNEQEAMINRLAASQKAHETVRGKPTQRVVSADVSDSLRAWMLEAQKADDET